MSNIEKFLTATEEEAVVDAIRNAEKDTSGEIRVHIEQNCKGDVYEHAMEVFHYLKMDNTKEQNGVLIYVAVDKKTFVIYGDKGINEAIDNNFWNATRDLIAHHFKRGNFAEGLIEGVKKAGQELSNHFPWYHGNANELDNTISKG
ncbi:MAG: TPM domain-containing protein [Winogradskyella sp.]|uniref:TPM domain-containing protein n=1 Tax=Winogradskyella sp. TaxID=1883156 RepID=UPI0017FB787F|nr:TPM domain-containing protein [Winogradskyella sp.]MBT8244533.1 TPM domain-containing protein [Winogradskyella sp.]NNK23676.1 TPM domain-containing protein [Winogradskyella sp.]